MGTVFIKPPLINENICTLLLEDTAKYFPSIEISNEYITSTSLNCIGFLSPFGLTCKIYVPPREAIAPLLDIFVYVTPSIFTINSISLSMLGIC